MESFNCKTPTAEIWSLIKAFKRRNLAQATNHNHDPLEERRVLELAKQKLCPPSCFQDITKSLEEMKQEDHNSNIPTEKIDFPITYNELDLAITHSNKRSAPGLDRISYKIIDRLPREFKELLVKLFNSFLANGVIPEEWKIALVIFIPKPDNSGMRPISLLSCTLKLMKKIVYWRLLWMAESKSLLPQEQMGFRPGRSCVESLVTFSNNIHASFISGKVVVAAFLDITGAFDCIHPSAILNELRAVGVPASIRKFVENLISDKNFTYKGTPQGSALSPLLFNVALRGIDGCISAGSEFLQYADDIVIYSSSDNTLDAQSSVQHSLDSVAMFLKEKGLELSPSKSKWMVFSSKKNLRQLKFPSPLIIKRSPEWSMQDF